MRTPHVPRYFFDIDDGDRRTLDDQGFDLPGLRETRDEAIRVLPDIARDVLPNGDHRSFIVTVREEGGLPIFKATLSLVAEWVQHSS